MAATIREVAKRARVAISTVSKVLNDPRYGSEEIRRRVLTAAAELQYQPHAIARSLVTRRSGTIGLVLPDLLNPVFPMVARSVEHTAREYGYNVVLCNTEGDEEIEEKYVRMFLSQRVDGIIFFAVYNRADIELIQQAGIGVVIIERPSDVEHADVVMVDNRQAACEATRHLIDLGHRRVGLIVGPLRGEVEQERFAGYARALQEAGLPVDRRLVRQCDYTVEDGQRAAASLLAEPVPPTAIFAACDIMAVGAVRAAESLGLRIPEALALVGFDDTLGRYTSPPLTSVAQPLDVLGRQATRLLIERLRAEAPPPYRREVFPAQLIVRASTVGSASAAKGPSAAEGPSSATGASAAAGAEAVMQASTAPGASTATEPTALSAGLPTASMPVSTDRIAEEPISEGG